LSHGDFEVEQAPGRGPDIPLSGPLAPLARGFHYLNLLVDFLGALALITAALVLTYSVVSRYFFKSNTDWQDEVAVFCIVGAVFMAGAYVQSYRGHIGIEALAAIMPPRANRIRSAIVDLLSFAFCTFFAWKSWTLWHEAWRDNQTTSSSFAPPLWIPYGLMAFGMTLLALMLLLQVFAHYYKIRGRA
jgi:TRAP-type C4-dicarboxylate transport system permease small subunit